MLLFEMILIKLKKDIKSKFYKTLVFELPNTDMPQTLASWDGFVYYVILLRSGIVQYHRIVLHN